MPPAYPAPSPAGNSPRVFRLWPSAPRAMRMGRGGARLHPGQHRVVHGEAGDVAGELPQRLADGLDGEAGQAGGQVGGLRRPVCRTARPSPSAARRSAGEQVADQLGRRGVGAAAGAEGARVPTPAGMRCRRAGVAGVVASGVMPTTMPALALNSAREYWLMPLVATQPGSDVAATTRPPGHMQKL